MSGLDLEPIKARADAATPGPWKTQRGVDDSDGWWGIESDKETIALARGWLDEEDADFIAHAREDVPRLIAEVERLLSALRDILPSSESHVESLTYCWRDIDDAECREVVADWQAKLRRAYDVAGVEPPEYSILKLGHTGAGCSCQNCPSSGSPPKEEVEHGA